MKYLIAIIILVVLVFVYVSLFILNSKVSKPQGCKQIDCNGCTLNCNKRGE